MSTFNKFKALNNRAADLYAKAALLQSFARTAESAKAQRRAWALEKEAKRLAGELGIPAY